MNLHISEIESFYKETELGIITSRFINESINKIDRLIVPRITESEVLIGYGYPNPYMKRITKNSSQTICLMPEQQGVVAWPQKGHNKAILIEETQWPLESETANMVIIAHGLETCENPHELLEEVWRVLVPEGYLLLVIPNRTGFWARSDLTPFGHGRPFSLTQLVHLLGENKFQITITQAALFTPPSSKRIFIKSSILLEKIGKKFGTKVMGGVIIMLAKKTIHAPTAIKLSDTIKVPLGILEGLIKPKPKPFPSDGCK